MILNLVLMEICTKSNKKVKHRIYLDLTDYEIETLSQSLKDLVIECTLKLRLVLRSLILTKWFYHYKTEPHIPCLLGSRLSSSKHGCSFYHLLLWQR